MALKDMFNEFTDVVSEGRNELVFENKNKEYGAYQIRRNYNHTMVIALTIASLSFLLAVGLPQIIKWLKPAETEEVVVPVDITPTDLEPPPIDETEPPPPPPPPPPPVEATIKFTPPVVVDEKVEDEEPPPPQEAITQNVSTVTQEGTGDDIVIPTDGTGSGIIEPEVEEPYVIVEQQPEFPGGEAAMYKYLSENIKYPPMEKENGISGKVYLTFVVDKEGRISNIKVLRGVKGGPGLEKEAMRVVERMPQWKPGKMGGRAVPVQYNLPINFSLK